MPCDIADSLKGGCETVFGLKFFNSIFSSTLWTAFLITAIVILLLMCFIPVEEDTPVRTLFKFMFYTFSSVIGILFLHNGTLTIKDKEDSEKKLSKDLQEAMVGGSSDIVNKGVEVKPEIQSSDGRDPIFEKYGV